MKIDKVLLILLLAVLLGWAAITNSMITFSVFLMFFILYAIMQLEIKFFLGIFIVLYPILPFHAGIDFGGSLPVLTVHRILIILLLLCWFNKRRLGWLVSFSKFPLSILLWIMIFAFTLSFSLRLNPKGLIFFIGNFLFENFIIGFIFYDILKDGSREDIKRTYYIVAISIVLPLALGIIEYLFKFNIFSKIEPYRELLKEAFPEQIRLGVLRVKGAFMHSISYGLFFAMALPAGLAVFVLRENKNKKYLLWIFIFIAACFIGAYLSFSRIAFTVFSLNAFVLLMFSNIFIAVIFSTTMFLIMLQPLFLASFKEKIIVLISGIFGTGLAPSEMILSSYGRIEQIRYSLKNIINYPFLGSGGTFDPGIIDNYYLTLIINNGILGLTAYLSFFIFVGILSGMALSRVEDKFFKTISFYTFLIIANTFLIFSVLSLTDYLYIIWIYIGIFMASRSICKEEKAGHGK